MNEPTRCIRVAIAFPVATHTSPVGVCGCVWRGVVAEVRVGGLARACSSNWRGAPHRSHGGTAAAAGGGGATLGHNGEASVWKQ